MSCLDCQKEDQLQVEEDCMAYRQEEDNMACCQGIEVVEEDRVGIDTEVAVVALLGHQGLDSYWTHHY